MAQNSTLPYYPARLVKGGRWYIVFYVTDPGNGTLVRRMIKWNRIADLREREKAGREMVRHLNEKMALGWNPMIEQDAAQSFTLLQDAFREYLRQAQVAYKSGKLRKDSVRSYRSYLEVFQKWMPNYESAYCVAFNRKVLMKFLDHVYYDLDRSARTRNNYLSFYRQVLAWMVEREYLPHNFAADIKMLPNTAKKRVIIPPALLAELWEALADRGDGFGLVCRLEYLTFIRRTELTKLKVKHLDLKNRLIYIPGSISKNGKDGQVTLTEGLAHSLAQHIDGVPKSWYLVSDHFWPGAKGISPKKISDTWRRVRKALGWPAKYQFYSLKDTGITAMLNAGIPSIVVRDQARHHSIQMTDTYASRATGAQAEILNYRDS